MHYCVSLKNVVFKLKYTTSVTKFLTISNIWVHRRCSDWTSEPLTHVKEILQAAEFKTLNIVQCFFPIITERVQLCFSGQPLFEPIKIELLKVIKSIMNWSTCTRWRRCIEFSKQEILWKCAGSILFFPCRLANTQTEYLIICCVNYNHFYW